MILKYYVFNLSLLLYEISMRSCNQVGGVFLS